MSWGELVNLAAMVAICLAGGALVRANIRSRVGKCECGAPAVRFGACSECDAEQQTYRAL